MPPPLQSPAQLLAAARFPTRSSQSDPSRTAEPASRIWRLGCGQTAPDSVLARGGGRRRRSGGPSLGEIHQRLDPLVTRRWPERAAHAPSAAASRLHARRSTASRASTSSGRPSAARALSTRSSGGTLALSPPVTGRSPISGRWRWARWRALGSPATASCGSSRGRTEPRASGVCATECSRLNVSGPKSDPC